MQFFGVDEGMRLGSGIGIEKLAGGCGRDSDSVQVREATIIAAVRTASVLSKSLDTNYEIAIYGSGTFVEPQV